ncbi:ATP-binding protein [Pseudanabaena sp. FACHB-2040]|uniref:ATP-binding protein n=1 Tax=Pseudanabaena sp. FACHB-2040 TaxID=2692859 RepID=UPI001683D6DA|nr:ATP-binding protein [Pseudanabaena sp. FACHB-2040]MBD2261424.1 ATP-binding protein [Pseudanabaena sp. FACHB-2040]
MNDLTRWHQQNEAYLAEALTWLRSRMYAYISAAASPEDPPPAAMLPQWQPPPNYDLPPPALVLLSQRLGLSGFEQELLLLCAAMELDTRIASLCAQAQDNLQAAYPTFALGFALFADPAWEALSPERPLRYWRLLEINQPGAQPLTTSPLRADERIVSYLKGLNYIDDRLSTLLVPIEPLSGDDLLAPSQLETVQSALGQHQIASLSRPPLLQLIGSDPLSKQVVAQHVAQQLGLSLYSLPVNLLPSPIHELEDLVRLWQRESLLLPFTLYLDAHEVDQIPTALEQFLARSRTLLFLSSRDVSPQLSRPVIVLDVDRPMAAEQAALWRQHLGPTVNEAALAGQFNLSAIAIHQIAQAELLQPQPYPDSLWQACLAKTRPQLDRLAQRLDTKATWDDIVLPPEEMGLLRQISEQVQQRSTVYQDWGFDQRMNRGFGISALFAGDSGTGKTMAAEVIANDLRLNLYRIDLSSVVSKYIGETEKNLRRLFDAAEDGGAILFFDEADALFGKRSEVKDSHDRYANIEINYLLQRIEAYRGLAILATNLKSSLDAALMRRLRFVITFSYPAIPQRQEMWQKAFPPSVPLETLDYARLARLSLTGGNIHSIALNAAFLAANAGTPVNMPLVLSAARTEFRKLGRSINEAEFRWQEPAALGR